MKPTLASDNGARLDSLTGLRYLAALMVAVFHVRTLFGKALFPSGVPLVDPTLVGSSGVTFFFILSGFVLMWSHRRGDTARLFLARRFARIYPTHILTTLCAVVLTLWIGSGFDWRHLVVDTFLLQSWIPSGPWVSHLNTVSWSLSDEAFFYVAFAATIGRPWARMRARWVIMLGCAWFAAFPVAMIALFPGNAWFCYFFPLYRVAEFGIGVALGLLARQGRLPRVGGGQAMLALGASWLLAGWVAASIQFPPEVGASAFVRSVVLSLIMAPSMALLITALARRDIAGKQSWLASSTMRRLGAWSFAFYLVHLQVIEVTARFFEPTNTLSALCVGAVAILMATALAGFINQTFEQPLERVIRRRLTRPRAQKSLPVMSGQGSNHQTKSADQEA